MSESVELTEAERDTYEAAFWANIAAQANEGPNTDVSWLCDEVADTVAQMLAAREAAARREAEDDPAHARMYRALVERAERAEAKVGRVEALAEDLESGGYWPPWQALAAGRIRAALAEPERDEEGGR